MQELERIRAASSDQVRMLVNTQTVSGKFHLASWDLYHQYSGVKNLVVRQCSPLSLVQVQRGSALIGRELQSVALEAVLCH